MSLFMVAALAYPISFASPSLAESAEARNVNKESSQIWNRLRDSRSFGNDNVIEDIERIAAECAEPDWDGYGGRSVARETVNLAKRVIYSLPLGFKQPTVGVESDGHLTLEWHASPLRTLSVSIGHEGVLHYSALIGMSRQFGTEPFLGQFPQTIRNLVVRTTRL